MMLFARVRRTERRTETESRRFSDRAARTDPQADAAEHSLTSDWSGGAGGALWGSVHVERLYGRVMWPHFLRLNTLITLNHPSA